MYFSLLTTIKENWFELLVMIGMTFGLLFGVIVGLVLLGDLDEPIYTEDAHSSMFYVSISGLIVLGICIGIMIKTFGENEMTNNMEGNPHE